MSKITVLRSNKTKSDKGYDVVELAYKTEEGKTKGMKIFPFGEQKEVAAVAANAKTGDVLEASFKQNEKGYWTFGSLKATGESAKTEDGVVARKTAGTWETAEERASRQETISRQAVLNTSVAYFEASKTKPSKEDVVEVAKFFLSFVKDRQTKQTGEIE